MLAGLLSLAACSETDTSQEEFADWQQKNETYFKNLYQTAQGNTAKYKIFKNWSFTADKATKPEDHIVVEVLKSGTGSGCPLYTDSVAVHYEGRLIPSATYSGRRLQSPDYEDRYAVAIEVCRRLYHCSDEHAHRRPLEGLHSLSTGLWHLNTVEFHHSSLFNAHLRHHARCLQPRRNPHSHHSGKALFCMD